jgi:hypothetical protein
VVIRGWKKIRELLTGEWEGENPKAGKLYGRKMEKGKTMEAN